MGLDIVEFVMAVEETFQVTIPDRIAEHLRTPRELIEYIYSQVPHGERSDCLTQNAFYALRQSLHDEGLAPLRNIRPSTRLHDLLPEKEWEQAWMSLGARLPEVAWTRLWPRSGWFGWGSLLLPDTVGAAARRLATQSAFVIKSTADKVSWTRFEITGVIHRLMVKYFAIYEYSLDDNFVEDLGLD